MKIYISLNFYFILLFSCACTQNGKQHIDSVAIAAYSGYDSIQAMFPSTDTKYIYLTFDDGPLLGSNYIDSIVLAEKIKVSVFVVGKNIEKGERLRNYFEKYRINPYIEVYNHSYTHATNRYEHFYKNPRKVVEDILTNQQKFDLPHKIVRLPGRNIWRTGGKKKNDIRNGLKAADLLVENGYIIFGWDLEWVRQTPTVTPVQTAEELMDQIESILSKSRTFTTNHLVLLMHDEMFQQSREKNILKKMIGILKEQNYIFEHIRHYPID